MEDVLLVLLSFGIFIQVHTISAHIIFYICTAAINVILILI